MKDLRGKYVNPLNLKLFVSSSVENAKETKIINLLCQHLAFSSSLDTQNKGSEQQEQFLEYQ